MAIKAYMICHVHWDREWYLTKNQFRSKLVRLVDSVLSGAPCTVTLDSRGFLEGTEENAFALGFPALLKRNFPRKTNG